MNEATPTITPAPQEIKLTPAQEARFWAKVNKAGPTMPGMASACWVWTAGKNKDGYGKFKAGKTFIAHRAAWIICNGIIPNDLCACHRCDNPACCRVDHLFLGTNADNMRDRSLKGRTARSFGDKNGARLHRESMIRGDKHHSRIRPGCLARGDKHGSKTHPEKLLRGEAHPQAKLTPSKVIDIRIRYAAGGITKKSLALEFGVCQAVVGDIISRKLWRHI